MTTEFLQQLDVHPFIKHRFTLRFQSPSPAQQLGWPKIAAADSNHGEHLSPSIERLMTLLDKEPTRISLSDTQKPLARTAAFPCGR